MDSTGSEITFTPNIETLFQGISRFKNPVHAIAEFVDNSIDASLHKDKCQINCHFFLAESSYPSYMMILDNGIGMDKEGIRKFAVYAWKPSDRTEGRLSARAIGKFGVGAKEGGFCLGDRITILSRPKFDGMRNSLNQDRPQDRIFEFTLDEKRLREASSNSGSGDFRGIVNVKSIHSPHVLPSFDGNSKPDYYDHMEDIVSKHLQSDNSTGTAIIIRLRPQFAGQLADEATWDNAIKELKDIYHFRLSPNELHFKDVSNSRAFQDEFKNIKPTMINTTWTLYNRGRMIQEKSYTLNENVSDFLDDCKIKQRRNRFEVKITVPSITDVEIDIFGFFWYLPFEKDCEQRPTLPDSVASLAGDLSEQCIIRCYWQHRLVPSEVLKSLPFMSNIDQHIKTGEISGKWRKRIVGILFFNQSFDFISNNKLRFTRDVERDLHQARDVLYSPTSSNAFYSWLQERCKEDKEFIFSDIRSSGPDKTVFNKLSYGGGQVLQSDSNPPLFLKLPLDTNSTDVLTAVKLSGFVVEPGVSEHLKSYNGAGKILVERLPLSLYGQRGKHELPTHILLSHNINRVTSSEITSLNSLKPSMIKVFRLHNSGRPIEIKDRSVGFSLGSTEYHLGFQLFQQDLRTITWHLPNLECSRNTRYGLKVVIFDENNRTITSGDWITWDLYYYGADKNGQTFEPRNARTARDCYFSFTLTSRTFQRKCGTYKLELSVLNPDKETILNKRSLLEIQVVGPRVAKSVLGSDEIGPIQLGLPIPSFQVEFQNEIGEVIVLEGDIKVELWSDDFEVGRLRPDENAASSTLLSQKTKQDVLLQSGFTGNSNWFIAPNSTNNHPLRNCELPTFRKKFQFALKFSSKVSRDIRIPDLNFSMEVCPGPPAHITSRLPLNDLQLDNENHRLFLIVADQWGNRVAPPAHEDWSLNLSTGPFQFVHGSPKTNVNRNGEILCDQNIVIDKEWINRLNGKTQVSQELSLRSSKGDVVVVSSQLNNLKGRRHNIPVTLQLRYKNKPLKDGEEVHATCGKSIEGITYTILNELGNEIAIPGGSTLSIMPFLTDAHQRRVQPIKANDTAADGYIRDLLAPTKAGSRSTAIKIIIEKKKTLQADLNLDVHPDEPCKWKLEIISQTLTRGNVWNELQDFMKGALLLDQYQNIIPFDPSNDDLLKRLPQPVLEIQQKLSDNQNAMEVDDEETKKVLIQLKSTINVAFTKTRGNKRNIESTDSAIRYVLPDSLPIDVINFFNDQFLPCQRLLLTVSSGSASSNAASSYTITSSESITCDIGLGVPHKLLISTKTYNINDPVDDGVINLPFRGQLTDLKFHVQDKFGQDHRELKDCTTANLNIYANDVVILAKTEKTSANKFLTQSLEIPQNVLRDVMKKINSEKPTFQLTFKMVVSIPNIHGDITTKTSNVQLSTAALTCRVVYANNVNGLYLEFEDEAKNAINKTSIDTHYDEISLPAGSNFPRIKIKCITEDGVPFNPLSSTVIDWFNITFEESSTYGSSKGKSNKSRELSFHDYYEESFDMDNGYIILQPRQIQVCSTLVQYKMDIQFVENRNGFESLLPKCKFKLKVESGQPSALVIAKASLQKLKQNVCLSENQALSCEIGRDIHIEAVDHLGNIVNLRDSDVIICRVIYQGTLQTNQHIPVLRGTDNTGVLKAQRPSSSSNSSIIFKDRKFSSIAIENATVNREATDGQYNLLFALYDENHTLLAENRSFSFNFTSNATYSEKLEEFRMKKLAPQKIIEEFEDLSKQLQELNDRREDLLDNLSSNELRDACEGRNIAQLKKCYQDVSQKQKELEERKLSIRQVRRNFSKNNALDNKLNQLPVELRDGIVGKMIDLASVKDRDYIHIVSFACRKLIDAVITKDTGTAKELFKREIKVVTIDQSHSTGRTLQPIKLDGNVTPPGNPKYLVNLLHFEEKYESLRWTICYDLLKDAIVFDTYLQAIDYRHFLASKRKALPMLYSRDGRQIAKDGIMDPSERSTIEDLDFTFAEHFGQQNDLNHSTQDLKNIKALEELENDCRELENDIEGMRNRFEEAQDVLKSIEEEKQEFMKNIFSF